MQRHISMIADRMKQASDERGIGTPAVILFHEGTLKQYVFDITQAEVVAVVEKMQKLLPSDQWAAVAFSVLQTNYDGEISNMGYLFTREGQPGFQAKREWSLNGDGINMGNYCEKNNLFLQLRIQKWELDGERLSNSKTPFLSAQAPNGQRFEVRVCRDVVAMPLIKDKEQITLVMAEGLPPEDLMGFVTFRKGVIVNDIGKNSAEIYPGEFARQTHTLNSYGIQIISLYED